LRTAFNGIWIGDSHASFLTEVPLRKFSSWQDDGNINCTLWLGPRLMHSISQNGFRSQWPRHLTAAKGAAVIAVFGEIDCRVHPEKQLLFDANSTSDWVPSYWQRMQNLVQDVGATHLFAVGPIPPHSKAAVRGKFPAAEPIELRVEATRILTANLERTAPKNALVINSQLLLGDGSGQLHNQFCEDGVHVNSEGASIIRKWVREHHECLKKES
jgi:lysophospholipase L1-like esterase